jgi:glycosyltransferase involved in cell wall biosynthesis
VASQTAAVRGRAARYRAVLDQRLREAARILLPGEAFADDLAVVSLIDALAEAVRVDAGDGRLWLLFTALAGAYPTPGQFEAARRRLELAAPGTATSVLLDATLEAASGSGEWDRPLRVVEDTTVIDVNFCAKFVHNTGIQRVVREVMPHLVALGAGADGATGAPVELVAWTRRSGVTRGLSAVERQRVIDWRAMAAGTSELPPPQPDELVVPWRSRLFLPEVPEPALCERLAALAQFSGNRVSIIGYDTIPIASADLVIPSESERFARYLSVVKHVDEVVAISHSVAAEFTGFAHALDAQGLKRPDIRCVPLAADVPAGDVPATESGEPREHTPVPLVLSVGSHEPRKNQDAVLFAAETLLGEGIDFRVVFVGGGNRRRTLSFDRHLRRLRAERGWRIESVRGMKDAELWQHFRDARFSVFMSLHEGYGLPVVESLALGTPVLTANYGSLAEIATAGGCVTADPRNDQQIVETMRALLTDDALVTRLETEAAAIPQRTWSDYAAELWREARLGESA